MRKIRGWLQPHGRPILTRGPIFYLFVFWFFLLSIGNGLALARIEHDRRADSVKSWVECQARNKNSTDSRKALEKLSRIGDKAEREFWSQYLEPGKVPNVANCGEKP